MGAILILGQDQIYCSRLTFLSNGSLLVTQNNSRENRQFCLEIWKKTIGELESHIQIVNIS
jgi:hypothetical protein